MRVALALRAAFHAAGSFIADVFPWNTGLCQLGATLDAYGPPGAAGWDRLDGVGRVRELRSPMLVLRGE
jgi:hypothetical protein